MCDAGHDEIRGDDRSTGAVGFRERGTSAQFPCEVSATDSGKAWTSSPRLPTPDTTSASEAWSTRVVRARLDTAQVARLERFAWQVSTELSGASRPWSAVHAAEQAIAIAGRHGFEFVDVDTPAAQRHGGE